MANIPRRALLPTSSPIADLTYRTYDGPLAEAKYRWWVIAKYTMLTSLKKKSLWVATAFSAWYYIAMFFFAYGALTFREQGFFYQDRWVFFKLILMCLLGAMLHSSLLIGFSSMFKQGRIAGATYAGLYFLSNFFTQMMAITWMMGQGGFRRHNGGGGIEHFQNTLVSNL